MGAIDDFGSDVNNIIADLNDQFKALNDAKRKLQERGNTIATKWSDYFQAQAKSIAAAEDALNRISNVPLSSAPTSEPGVQPLSAIPIRGER